MAMPLSDERLTEIRERAEYEYPIYEDQPWDPEHAAILFLSEAATDLLNELDRLRARVAELEDANTRMRQRLESLL